MMDNKEIENWLEKHRATKEDFDNFNLSQDDMMKILTDQKGYIREKLGIDENKTTKTIKAIKINEESIKMIAQEIKIESLLEKHGWELIK